MKLKVIGIIILLLCVAGAGWYVLAQNNPTSEQPDVTVGEVSQEPKTSTVIEPEFDKSTYSIDEPSSIWVVTNKQRQLTPKGYVPSDLVFPAVRLRVPGNESMQLRKDTAAALLEMFNDASTDGIELMLSSGYRSYNYQVNLYGSYVNSQGQAQADTQSARPGYSEHQTGLAADIRPINGKCELEQCFGDLPEGKWIAANAHKYGFVIRYPQGSKAVVGYEYEPWHVRYIGKDAASEYKTKNIQTLEEFFGLPPAPDYSS